jgi:hypothetical protein
MADAAAAADWLGSGQVNTSVPNEQARRESESEGLRNGARNKELTACCNVTLTSPCGRYQTLNYHVRFRTAYACGRSIDHTCTFVTCGGV